MTSQSRIESNRILREWCAPITGAVLSIGSGDDRDGQGSHYRSYFSGAASYTTSEVSPVLGCDQVLDVQHMPEVPTGSYDAVYCSGVLEHLREPSGAMDELWRVLKPGGTLLLGLPFRQAIHLAPNDYWRFTEHGVAELLQGAGFEAVELVAVDASVDARFPAAYWSRARKPVEPPRPGRLGRLPESIVCWLWSTPGYGVTYTARHVNTLREMVDRHYPHRHRFICVTDERAGLDPRVEVVPPWGDFAGVLNPHGPRFPSCYRRLRMFAPDVEAVFGKRFVSMDLDCVATGDLTPLFDRPEEFVAWKDTHPRAGYNGSLVMLTAGARRRVWDTFDPAGAPRLTLEAGNCNGSDQGWISYCLGPGEATWTGADGVYSFKNELSGKMSLPSNARLVVFHGRVKPWARAAQRFSWVRRHYCVGSA